jgi:hypothetical protein
MDFVHIKVSKYLADYETAASAVRNLNNYDIGGRQLRVDFAESDKEALIESDRILILMQEIRMDNNEFLARNSQYILHQ